MPSWSYQRKLITALIAIGLLAILSSGASLVVSRLIVASVDKVATSQARDLTDSRQLQLSGLRKILDARTRQQEQEYSQAVPAGAGLKDRVKALARLRDNEGYMTEVESDGDGGFRLIENHCPICTAAKTCQGFCQSEWQVFSNVMGPDSRVTREEHLLSGGRRCVYSIRPAKPNTNGGGK